MREVEGLIEGVIEGKQLVRERERGEDYVLECVCMCVCRSRTHYVIANLGNDVLLGVVWV